MIPSNTIRLLIIAILVGGWFSVGFGQGAFKVFLSKGAFQLDQAGYETQRLDEAVTQARIALGSNQVLTLSKFSFGTTPASWLSSQKRPLRRVDAGKVLLAGVKGLEGNLIQSPSDGGTLSQECQEVILWEDGTEVVIVLPIEPIAIELAGERLRFSRDTVVEMDISHSNPVYLLTCPELLGNQSVAVTDSGLSITILVDNIFDPKVYYPSAKMSLESGLIKQWKKEMAQQENLPMGDCVEVIDWQDQPQVEVNMADGVSFMEIVCNRYLMVHTPEGDYCVDLVTCGAYFTLSEKNPKVVQLRTACPKLPANCIGN